jgi:two-component system NarL family response regulator
MKETSEKTRVILVDDLRMVRAGLRALLGACPDIEVIGESDTQTLLLMNLPGVDVIVMGVSRTCHHPTAIVGPVLRKWPQAKVVILSAALSRVLLREFFHAGVQGCVTLRCASNELLAAVRTVASGSTYLCPEATQMLLDDYTGGGPDSEQTEGTLLTERETTILQFLADGRTSKEIAAALHLSSKTIDACRRQLMRKLEVDSMAGLVKRAILMEMTTMTPRPAQVQIRWESGKRHDASTRGESKAEYVGGTDAAGVAGGGRSHGGGILRSGV